MKLKGCLYLYTIFFATTNGAWAVCNIPAGKYGHWVGCSFSDCPSGCYCPGNTGNTESVSHNNLKSYCGGIKDYSALGGGDKKTADRYLKKCPSNFPKSPTGAKSAEDCYADVGGKPVHDKSMELEPGKYLPINSDSLVPCKTGERDYCPGGMTVRTSFDSDQGIKECLSDQKANSTHTACEDNGITCIAGTYLPAHSLTCAACPDGYYCKGGTWPQQPIDQGNKRCSGSMVPNEKRTDCIQGTITVSAGYYLPANATEPVPCKGAKSYCPGGKFDQSPKDQGIFDCPNGGRANKDKNACSITLKAEQMKACWQESGDPDKYKTCVLAKRYYK